MNHWMLLPAADRSPRMHHVSTRLCQGARKRLLGWSQPPCLDWRTSGSHQCCSLSPLQALGELSVCPFSMIKNMFFWRGDQGESIHWKCMEHHGANMSQPPKSHSSQGLGSTSCDILCHFSSPGSAARSSTKSGLESSTNPWGPIRSRHHCIQSTRDDTTASQLQKQRETTTVTRSTASTVSTAVLEERKMLRTSAVVGPLFLQTRNVLRCEDIAINISRQWDWDGLWLHLRLPRLKLLHEFSGNFLFPSKRWKGFPSHDPQPSATLPVSWPGILWIAHVNQSAKTSLVLRRHVRVIGGGAHRMRVELVVEETTCNFKPKHVA